MSSALVFLKEGSISIYKSTPAMFPEGCLVVGIKVRGHLIQRWVFKRCVHP